MTDKLTTADSVRAAFWEENPDVSRRKIRSYDGRGQMFTTDTRCAFVDWLDAAERAGRVSPALAQRVTLRSE